MWMLFAALALAVSQPAKNESYRLVAPNQPALGVRHLSGPGPSVLYVHGATFPSDLSVGYPIDGRSWSDDLHSRGFDVWSFDFAGYGGSDRPPSMRLARMSRDKVPGRATEASRQIERLVAHIRERTGGRKVSIVAHSWGTIPAGMFAADHHDWIDRLVLFGPVAMRDGREQLASEVEPATFVSEPDQWQSFQSGVPRGQPSLISEATFEVWAKAYLSTDPASGDRTPASVQVPAGPGVDLADSWNGRFPYDPARVRTPTLIVRGEWDPITRDSDAAWLAKALKNVPLGPRDVKLRGGAHRMHLETNRQKLFDAVGSFLAEGR